MKILVLDNYDSFTYNLVYLVRQLCSDVTVYRNDKISLEAVGAYDKILLSPGPGIPSEAGIMHEVIQKYALTKSILGVCLGHQGIAEAFGAKIENMTEVFHGVADTAIFTDLNATLFRGLPQQITVGRYHSWTVIPESLPSCLRITAVDSHDRIMGLSHTEYDVHGVQFHPESVLTEFGKAMMENWVKG